MPPVNRTIVGASLIIMASGLYHFFVSGGKANKQNTTMTRIFVGGFMLALFASFFDLFGFGIGQVAGWILMLAMGVAIFTVATDLASRVNAKQKGA